MTDYPLLPPDGGLTSVSDTGYSAGLEFYATDTAWLKAIHFHRTAENITGTIPGKAWTIDGAELDGSAVTFTYSGTGWQTAYLTTPVPLVPNDRYRAGVYFPNYHPVQINYWNSGPGASGVTSGIAVAPSSANATGGHQSPRVAGPTFVFPDSSASNKGNYGVGVTLTDTDPTVAPGTYSLWPSVSSIGAPGSITGTFTTATEFHTTWPCQLTALRFFRTNTSITGTITGRLYTVTTATTGDPVTGTDVTFTLSGTGWQQANLATPVDLTPGQIYRAAGFFPSGLPTTDNYWNTGAGSSGITSGPLVAPSAANAVGNLQGSYRPGSPMGFPNEGNTVRGCYWIDPVVTVPAPPQSGQFFAFF